MHSTQFWTVKSNRGWRVKPILPSMHGSEGNWVCTRLQLAFYEWNSFYGTEFISWMGWDEMCDLCLFPFESSARLSCICFKSTLGFDGFQLIPYCTWNVSTTVLSSSLTGKIPWLLHSLHGSSFLASIPSYWSSHTELKEIWVFLKHAHW